MAVREMQARAACEKLNASGKTVKEIHDLTGFPLSSIYHYLRDSYNRSNRGVSDEDKQQLIDMREAGMSFREIAKITGLNKETVKHRCRHLGIAGYHRGYDPRSQAKTEQEVIDGIKRLCPDSDFTYVSGYVDFNSRITVRCGKCGNAFERQYNNFYNFKACPYCIAAERERIAKEKADAKKSKRKAENEKLRALEIERRAIEKAKKEEQKQKLLEKERICINCGEKYKWIDSGYHGKKYCSLTCRTRFENRNSRRERYRKRKAVKQDKDITLMKLYRRDSGRCWICGMQCNYDDYTYQGDTFIAGNYYPSIDHVIPLSKAGNDTWDNVRLAHRLCNSIKHDSIY